MKRTTFLSATIFLLLFSFPGQAQQSASKKALAVTFSGLGENDAFHWKSLTGAGGYDGKGFFSLGISYIQALTKTIDLETGLEYSRFNYRYSNASLGPEGQEPFNLTNSILEIPATIRFNFLKYFFLNTGLLFDIDTGADNHMDSQSGIGAIVGVGAKYDFRNLPIGFFVNPYFKHHTLLSFPLEPGNHQLRTSDSGFRFGIAYRFSGK